MDSGTAGRHALQWHCSLVRAAKYFAKCFVAEEVLVGGGGGGVVVVVVLVVVVKAASGVKAEVGLAGEVLRPPSVQFVVCGYSVPTPAGQTISAETLLL